MEVAVPEARYARELCRDGPLRPQKRIAQRRLHPWPCHSSRFTGRSEGELAMRAWPDLTEYHEAVQHPPKAFADRGLKAVTLELDRFGMPKPATGGNAVVYRANEPGGFLIFKKTWAIRCFLRPISDHAERYEAISKHLRKVRLPYDVNFQFLKQGIQIRSNWFPIVKMQWAKGDLLHSHIEKHLAYPAALAALRAKWAILVRHLEAAKVAHGDLQHGNIMVRGGSIQLVDYDGMWVPALSGRHATESGHRAYQHPERSGQDYGQEIDRFSALVIYLSLAALERDVALWERFHTGDNLIFVREDFQQLGRSAIWQQLRRSEEHTSELQSRSDLVCRLLLEKKKQKTHTITLPTDADVVATHIKTWLLTLFYRQIPTLAVAGHVFPRQPPSYYPMHCTTSRAP